MLLSRRSRSGRRWPRAFLRPMRDLPSHHCRPPRGRRRNDLEGLRSHSARSCPGEAGRGGGGLGRFSARCAISRRTIACRPRGRKRHGLEGVRSHSARSCPGEAGRGGGGLGRFSARCAISRRTIACRPRGRKRHGLEGVPGPTALAPVPEKPVGEAVASGVSPPDARSLPSHHCLPAARPRWVWC